MFKTTYHNDGTVTLWNVYEQNWERGASFSDAVLASLAIEERQAVENHLEAFPPIALCERCERAMPEMEYAVDGICENCQLILARRK